MQILFWTAVFLLAHAYFLYPLSLLAADRWSRRARKAPRAPDEGPGGSTPFVTLLVAAHNEEACIRRKLENSLAVEYPPDRFEVLIGSDGSTDGTDECVRGFQDARVRLLSAPRAGKTSVLNRCIPEARGEIIVLTDANTQLDPKSVKRLVDPFREPTTAAVCGRLVLFNPTRPSYEESAYWRYESTLKALEGQHGAVLGANGGLYAIRKAFFQPLHPSTVVDDFVLPMRMLLQGRPVVFEPTAFAYEETTEDYSREFARRARIAAGNFQSLKWLWPLLSPRRGFVAYAFWSHKVLRWVAPGLLLTALLANALLWEEGGVLYRSTLLAQGVFYALALLGSVGWLPHALQRVASMAYYFVSMNLALATGFWRFLRNSQSAAWERTSRSG